MPGGSFDPLTNGAKLPPRPTVKAPGDMALEELLEELRMEPGHIRNILKLPKERTLRPERPPPPKKRGSVAPYPRPPRQWKDVKKRAELADLDDIGGEMRVVPFHERVARPRLSEHAAHHSHGRKPFEPIENARNDHVSAHDHEHRHGHADDTKSEVGSKVSMLSRKSTRAAAASTSDRVTHEFKFKTTSTRLYAEYYTTGSTTDVQPQDFFEEVEMQRAREAKQRSLSNFEAQWIGRGRSPLGAAGEPFHLRREPATIDQIRARSKSYKEAGKFQSTG